jgi:hypothetical protein
MEDNEHWEVVKIKRVLQQDMVKTKADSHVIFRCEAIK